MQQRVPETFSSASAGNILSGYSLYLLLGSYTALYFETADGQTTIYSHNLKQGRALFEGQRWSNPKTNGLLNRIWYLGKCFNC